MPDNTNVNNNASVVVVGRTAPVPPGQQKSDKSVPVVIASDQSTIPVAEQNKVQSEVALSLLGIPRSEVALGIFADVNTYDVNPTEWASEPDQFTSVDTTSGYYSDINSDMGHGLSHIPEESGALLEAPADKSAVLTSKRFFRYQPGRVSAATFGVKTTILNPSTTDASTSLSDSQKQDIGSTVYNPAIRKYGIFDNFDGYYWETRNNGQGDNFCVVRRTQSLLFFNPVTFGTGSNDQTSDFGATNPLDVLAPRPNETPDDKVINGVGQPISFYDGQTYPTDHNSTPVKYQSLQTRLGDLVIYRDNLMMTHAGVYDPSILQDEVKAGITSIGADNVIFFDSSNSASNSGIGRSIEGAVYDINTGLMTINCHGDHGFTEGKYIRLSGIGMTCQYSYVNPATGNYESTIQSGGIKTYPDRTYGYNILRVGTTTSFTINVGVSTVPTFYHSGGLVLGLSTSQYVIYDKGNDASGNPNTQLTGLIDQKIYKVNTISYDEVEEKVGITLKDISAKMSDDMGGGAYNPYKAQDSKKITGITQDTSVPVGHGLVTPVPFIQPVDDGIITGKNRYGTNAQGKKSGMFPYAYKNAENVVVEGYIDTTIPNTSISNLKAEIENVNLFYRDWINQNVKKDFWNVYEYRVPRSRFSGDRLDNDTKPLLYSDVTADNRAGDNVVNETTGAITNDTSIWNLEFDKVTMYKIEFSWYGAVGALFLAYVPVGAGEARWVRVHHLRASNQLKGSSLGNATLPITYMVYGGGSSGPSDVLTRYGYLNAKKTDTELPYGSSSEHIVKYGASYYIDGGDRGTVKLFSHGTPSGVEVFGSRRTFTVGANTGVTITQSNAVDNATDPKITLGSNVTVGFTSSYFVGAKIDVPNSNLDQNVEVVYVNGRDLHLNVPLSAVPSGSINIIVNRPTPLIGLKCRDFITSSQGREVRNRTQVYPTRLSTGSEGSVIKVDLLKTPIFQTTSTITGSAPTLSADVNIGKRGKAFLLSVSNNTYLAEGTGVYGYFRGQFANDAANKVVTVFGYLERRLSTSPTPGYYFRAENATEDEIILKATIGSTSFPFLVEGQLNPKGEDVSSAQSDFTLDPLSSIKVSPQIRAPIPKTGTIVASLFIPASGEEFDLSSYFDYNKEYLSFPLTNVVESLFVVGSSEKTYNSASEISTTNASITWEEQ